MYEPDLLLKFATRRLQKKGMSIAMDALYNAPHEKEERCLILSFPLYVYRVVSEETRRTLYTRRDIMVEVIILSLIGVFILGSISNGFTKK